MALDPLKFQVAIIDEATTKLSSIEAALNSLKDKNITVTVNGLSDLQQLLSALQHQQVSNLGKDVGNAINEASRNLQKEAQDAVRTSLGNLAQDLASIKAAIQNDNFTAFSNRIQTCAEKVNLLDEAFKKFKVTVGEDKGLKDILAGLGAAIREVSSSMSAMNSVKNGGGAKAAQKEELKQQEEGLIRVANAMGRVRDLASGSGNSAGGVAFMESINKVGERNIQTLIKEQGHIERLIAIAKKSIDFGEGHPVLGMGRLRGDQMQNLQNLEQLKNIIKEILFAANQGDQAAIRFLNTLGSLKTISFGKDLMGNNITLLGGHFDQLTHSVTGTASAMRQLNKDMRLDFNKVANKEKLAAEAEAVRKLAASYKSMQQESNAMRSQSESALASRIRMLREQSADLQKLLSVGKSGLGEGQYNSVRDALREIRRELQQIETITQRGGNSTGLLRSLSVGRDYGGVIASGQAVADMRNKQAQQTNLASRAVSQLTMEEQKLAQALNQTTQAAHGQNQVLSDLKSMATQYLGVWGGQQFIHNIIEIGGQLEMQRLSIGAILQNTAHANELFNKIKGLATQSPFGAVQLDQMTKQLTAYGFKYNELYDMTKRLADISAATGTDVSRLALALGHVRSEAALSGYTLRQFSMGNVPLLQKLSEKLGKTSKEIRDMVKKKEIGYDDVIGVLKDLTNEGGMFYNMQEVISQSVKAKFKNVKDAMDIMYGEMAEGAPGEALKEVANVLMELTRKWKDVATVMGSVAGVWAIHRAAIFAMNAALGSNTASITANMLAYKQRRAAELQSEALTRKLTAEELALVATRKQITAANIRVALSTNAITKGEALRLVGLRKLSLEEAKALIRSGEFTAAEVRMALQGRVLGMNLGYAGNMMRYFAVQAKAAMVALLSNPWTWAMAGIIAAIELWQRNNQELERAKELNDDIYNRSQEGLKNTRMMMQNTGIRVDWRKDENDKWSDVTGTFGQQTGGRIRFVKPDFDKNDNIEGVIEAWQQYIRDYAATPNRLINEAMTSSETVKGEDGIEKVTTKIREQREQYDLLYESVINVSKAQQQMANLSDAMEFAVNETNSGLGGWFNDDLLTNIGDYDKEVKKVSQNIAKTYGDLRKHIDVTIRKAQKEDENFAKATKGMDNYSQAFEHLVKNHEKFSKADEIFKASYFGVSGAYEGLLGGGLFDGGSMSALEDARKTMEEDLNQFFTSLDNQLRNQKGWHIDEVLAGKMTLSEDKQQALLSSWKDALSKVQGLTDETARDLTQKFSERYHIPIDAETENAIVKIAQLEQSLNNLVDGDYKVSVETMTNAEAVFDKLKKDYKAAKSYIETSKPILAKFGISFTGKALSQEQINKALSKITDEGIRGEVSKILQGFNQAMGELGKTQEAANNIGLKLDDGKKKGTGSKKTGGTKSYKDEFAKRWDERIRIMKEAYSWYDKWEKKVGNDEAIKETNAKYADIFKEWRTDKLLPMDFDVNEIADYAKYVEKIRDDALKRYQAQKNDKGKNNGQEALRVYRQAVSLLNDVKFDNFAKAAEEFRSIIEQTIEDLNERWDIFDTIRNATGNVGLATRIAGFGAAEVGARTSADAMRNELLNQLRSAGGENLLSQIPLDVKIDEEGLRTMLEKAIPKAEDAERYKEKIDGLIKAYQEWQKLQRKVIKDDVNVFANLVGAAVSYDAQVKKLQDKLNQQKDSINASVLAGTISQSDADKANEIAQAQFDWEKMKLSADYANIYNNAIAMSRTEFEQATAAVEKMIARLKELGLITPEQAIQEQQKIDKARQEFGATGFLGERGAVGQFISGGYDGLMNYYAKRRDIAKQNEERSTTDKDKKRWRDEAEYYGKLFMRISKLSDATKDVVTAFSTLQSGLDLVSNLFDSLGMEGASNAIGDAAGVAGNAMQGAQSLSVLGPWGMAAGAGLGLIGGIAQTHDKALEREIQKLREDVRGIEDNTSLILQARERTLGFDEGDVRRSFAESYSADVPDLSELSGSFLGSFLRNSSFGRGFKSDAEEEMFKYYSRNSEGNGYQQQYRNLLSEREDYIEMYNAENDKKKKSSEALDEYKKKIAELDDQIRYFSMDLAKELFSIDVKGWADQLSDALSSAFENGESAAKAYKETVTNILQQVMNKMMQMAILEPMFQSLQDKLFGNTAKNIKGVFDVSNPQKSMGSVISVITDFFGKGGEGEQSITAALEFMNAFERGLNNAGLSVMNSDSANTLSSGIKGTSEETSDLLAGYVNALRQDVAVNRILITQFVSELWPSYIEQFSAAVTSLNNIDNNVSSIRALLSENGALYSIIESMKSHLDSITNGNEFVSVR